MEQDFPLTIAITDLEKQESGALPLKQVTISLAVEIQEHILTVLQLQHGELSEFHIPLHYNIQNGFAYATFNIAPLYLESLEVLYIYSGRCNVAVRQVVDN